MSVQEWTAEVDKRGKGGRRDVKGRKGRVVLYEYTISFLPRDIVLIRWQIRICDIYGALPAVCSARRVGIEEVLGSRLEYGIERPVYLTFQLLCRVGSRCNSPSSVLAHVETFVLLNPDYQTGILQHPTLKRLVRGSILEDGFPPRFMDILGIAVGRRCRCSLFYSSTFYGLGIRLNNYFSSTSHYV